MRRYRVLGFDFDSRPAILAQKIEGHWESSVQAQWRKNQGEIRRGIVLQYGEGAIDEKVRNFIDLGSSPFSVLAFHNKFLSQCRDAFVEGAYYPAATGACALGERILNHLLLRLRVYFSGTPEYKRVCRKDAFDNWDLAISTLVAWDVFLPDTATSFRGLAKLRHGVIHFRPETDTNDRVLALQAINLLQRIVGNQFSAFGPQPWFIKGIPGEAYIMKEWETRPFVREVYVPNGRLVGPGHRIEFQGQQIIVIDEKYPDTDITDERFVELRKERKGKENGARESNGPEI
jgi:hypothetical protein